MFDDPKPATQAVNQPAPDDNQEQPEEVETEVQPAQMQDESNSGYGARAPETIKVSGGGLAQQMSTFSGFIILGIFLVLEFLGFLLNFYYFLLFLVLIFVVPTAIRRSTSVIQFTGQDFLFKHTGSADTYPLMDIENVKIDHYNRMDQTLTINFREGRPPLQVEFNSFVAFRSVLTAFNRRRIPILNSMAQSNAQRQGM